MLHCKNQARLDRPERSRLPRLPLPVSIGVRKIRAILHRSPAGSTEDRCEAGFCSGCFWPANEFYESGNFWLPEGYHYTFHGPPVAEGEAVVCSARLDVRPAATTALHYPFRAYPRDCTTDVNPADNTVDLVIGGLLPTPVPLAGLSDRIGRAWLLFLALVIAYAATRHTRTSTRHPQ